MTSANPHHSFKIGDVVDYTTVKGFPVCPKCGLHGDFRFYKDGAVAVFHKLQLVAYGWNVIDGCYLTVAEAKDIKRPE